MVYKFFDKKSSGSAFTLNQIISSQMNFLSRLSKNLKDKKFIHPLETIFGVLP